jgi:tight adherence protein B
MTFGRRVAAGAVCTVVLALAIPAFAFGQTAAGVRIREAKLDADGLVRLVVQVSGPLVERQLKAANFTVTEADRRVKDLRVASLTQAAATVPVAVALAMDTSGSTAGKPIADAKSAAKAFLGQLPPSVQVALIRFADKASVGVGLTSDRSRLGKAIDGLQAGGSTALYRGVALAAQTLGRVQAQRNIVLFSDGADTVGGPNLTQVTKSANGIGAPVTAVALSTPDLDAAALGALAQGTKGRVVSVAQSTQLAGAFRQVAKELSSQYVLTYTATAKEPKEMPLSVAVTAGSLGAVDRVVVSNPRVDAPKGGPNAPRVVGPPKPLLGVFAGDTGKYVAIGAGGLAVLLFFGMILWQPRGSRSMQVLQRGLRVYQRGDRRKKRGIEGGLTATAFGRRAVELVDRVPRSQASLEKVQLKLDRAGWPLRSNEFVLVQIAGALAGAILGFGLLQRWWIGLVFIALGAVLPQAVLRQRIDKRSSTFLSQLPDTLQLLSGTLQAGYGFLQGLDTLVKESPAPTSTEFNRVLSEARLGMPVEDALQGMADRMGSEDFRWVVLAINIQRQVGGNLAQLLTTVANTLREREAVRRQIKVLSAEGRLSAAVLVALPFAIAGYISVANPQFIQTLTGDKLGRTLIGGALVLMAIGAAWMRKLIKIDV